MTTKLILDKEEWGDPSPDLIALDGKSLLLVVDGKQQQLHIDILKADPAGTNAGKIAICVRQAVEKPVIFTNHTQSNQISEINMTIWEKFLSFSLIPSITLSTTLCDYKLHLKDE